MKMLTHIMFGAGVVAALFPSLPLGVRLPLAGSSSILVNFAIDSFGHTMHGGFVARSPLTHSVVTAPVWGGALGYVLWAAGSGLGAVGGGVEMAFIALGVVVALAHLLLDSVTERGVYLVMGRVALARFRSGDRVLNRLFVVLGVALFLL